MQNVQVISAKRADINISIMLHYIVQNQYPCSKSKIYFHLNIL